MKRDKELKRQKEYLAIHSRAVDEGTTNIVKRLEERVAKISKIKSKLENRRAFRLLEESELEKGPGLLQAIMKTWAWARGGVELDIATLMRGNVEGDQETSK